MSESLKIEVDGFVVVTIRQHAGKDSTMTVQGVMGKEEALATYSGLEETLKLSSVVLPVSIKLDYADLVERTAKAFEKRADSVAQKLKRLEKTE